MSQLGKLASGMGAAFRQAREDYNKVRECFTDGDHIAKLQSCNRHESKAGNQAIHIEWYDTEGEQRGHIEHQYLMLLPERIQDVFRFFSAFGLDTSPLCSDDDDVIDSTITAYCEALHNVSPLVKLKAKRWYRKDDNGVTTDELGGCNISIKSIIEPTDGIVVGVVAATVETDTGSTETTDDLDSLDKIALKKLIREDDALFEAIDMKWFATATVEQIREIIRDFRSQVSSSDTVDTNKDDENLRKRLLELCEAQGISEATSDMSVDEIKNCIWDEQKKEGYTFNPDELTEEETATLIDAGLENQLKRPEPVKKAAAKKK